ncbi:MAG: hypothetical protein V4675_03635 [Verrucomicrobiota bacterium]
MKRYDFVMFRWGRSHVVVILTDRACSSKDLAKIDEASRLRWPEHLRVFCREDEEGEADFIGGNDEILSIINGCPMDHLKGLVSGKIAS